MNRGPGTDDRPSRRQVMRYAGGAAAAAALAPDLLWARPASRGGGGGPNFLWITCEDLSPMLGCYGDAYATTPRLDALARQSVRYDNAFAPSPVCSPARTGLIFGRHAVSLGANNHRSRPETPPDVRGYADHLREAGYWTANHTKTDYNTSRVKQIVRDCWDSDGTWRDRPDDGRPFLSVVNLHETHASRGMVWGYDRFRREIQARLDSAEVHDLADAPLPPWLPDTPTMRRGVARYHDCVTHMDAVVGGLLKDLGEDGLADDTIVFFFSDHGTGLPRYKQTALDTGLRVPLLVRFPEKWQHLAEGPPGSASDRLVSFVDFGPSLLVLAGAAVPATMQGTPMLPADAGPRREVVFGARDRLDEAYDVQRTVRDGRYRYLRNFMPHVPHLQQNDYWRRSEVAEELFAMLRDGTLPEETARLFRPKAAEELYDLREDPAELNNLAGDPAHAARLEKMRGQLAAEMRRVGDLNIVHEAELEARADGTPLAELGEDVLPLEKIIAAAETVGAANTARLAELVGDGDSMVRWWATIALRQLDEDAEAADLLRRLAGDDHPLVAGEAALALLARGDAGAGDLVVRSLSEAPDDFAEYLARMAIYSGETEAVGPVLARASERRGDFKPLRRAAQALGQLGR